MHLDLAGSPKKKRFINVERLGQKRDECGQDNERECPMGMKCTPLPDFTQRLFVEAPCRSGHVNSF